MEMVELAGYGVPAAVIAAWRAKQGERLLPLQEQAVRDYNLFGADNLLVQAPTSSGKTFVGEMAAIHGALQRRKTVYLLPLKALAEEKYVSFRERYAPLGLRVIVCTRDHRAFDGAFERGDFDIATAVYEKMEHLAAAHPERLNELSLVVADELEILSDEERGAEVELLLTRLLTLGTRIIGLSAVLGAPEQPAAWLRARLLEYARRPRELRYGVLYDGTFRYCGHNDHAEGEESFAEMCGETPWDEVVGNVCRLAEAGECCLIFVKSRREARRGAELLAQRLRLPAAATAAEAVRAGEPTRARDALLQLLDNGTAFHSADLLPGERRAVETAFRAGEVKVLVATNTLATGMNLPAHNVFISADKWIYDPCLDLPWRAPISRGEFENMSGRAGRYGAPGAQGRAILVAASSFDRDALWRRYVKGRREAVQPRLARAPFENAVLHLLAARQCRTVEALAAFFAQTLSARQVWADRHSDEEIAFRIRGALRRCLDTGMARASNADGAAVAPEEHTDLDALRFDIEPVGRVTALKGMSLACARALLHWLRVSQHRDWPAIDLLVALALAPDASLRQVTLGQREYEAADYAGRLKQASAAVELGADTPLNRLRNTRTAPFHDEARAIKAALFLADWMDEKPLHEIEADYDISAGQLRDAADQLAWLADGAAALAEAGQLAQPLADAVRRIGEQLVFGVREETLPLAQAVPDAPRTAILRLAAANLIYPGPLRRVDARTLEPWLTPEQAAAVKRWAADAGGEPDEPNGAAVASAPPRLVVDDGRPDAIEVDGVAVAVQDKQYRLVRLLAAHPGQCVSYEDIYRQVWGDVIVEDNQMHYQKRMLVKRLTEANPAYADLVGTIAKRGFVLKLAPEQVLLRTADMHAA